MRSTTNRLLFVLGVALFLVGLATCDDDHRDPPVRICRISDRSSACLRGEFCALSLGMCGEVPHLPPKSSKPMGVLVSQF